MTWRLIIGNDAAGLVVEKNGLALKGVGGVSSPVIDDNGITYVMDYAGYLHAYYPFWLQEVFLKKLTTLGMQVGGPIIGPDGGVYITTSSNVFIKLGNP
jgi:hypothetical protein